MLSFWSLLSLFIYTFECLPRSHISEIGKKAYQRIAMTKCCIMNLTSKKGKNHLTLHLFDQYLNIGLLSRTQAKMKILTYCTLLQAKSAYHLFSQDANSLICLRHRKYSMANIKWKWTISAPSQTGGCMVTLTNWSSNSKLLQDPTFSPWELNSYVVNMPMLAIFKKKLKFLLK